MTAFLTRLFLHARSRDVRRDLASPVELHRTVMRLFPDSLAEDGVGARERLAVLHRIDEDPRTHQIVMLVQAKVAPDVSRLAEGYVDENAEPPATRPTSDWARLEAGQRLVFRLRANTTRKIDTKTRADGTHSNGKRVPVRGDEARFAWLSRHGDAAGFAVQPGDVRMAEVTSAGGGKTFAGALFDGELVITDTTRFRDALIRGIGPAKAFGYGLLSIRRVGG